MIYLDNAATTQIDKRVLEEMMPYLTDEYGNAGSMHSMGKTAAKAIDKARERVALSIGADPDQIIFTSGGTEANNIAVRSFKASKDETILTSKTEHDSVYKTILDVCKKTGARIQTIPTTEKGYVSTNIDSLENILLKKKRRSSPVTCATVMYVNNETGAKNDVCRFGDFFKHNDIKFHTDCVQALGFADINVAEIKCDTLSVSSHKIHGPKGIGALYVKDKNNINPLIIGGKYQEFGLRGGTENVAAIVGFGKACEIAKEERPKNVEEIKNMNCMFVGILLENLYSHGLSNIVHLNSLVTNRTLNILFKNIDAQTLVLMLDADGVCVSAGSACRSHETKPSRVLRAMGLSDDDAMCSIRVSFSSFNTLKEAEDAAVVIAKNVAKLNDGMV